MNFPDYSDFTCNCTSSFTGTLCETPIPCETDPNPCLHESSCHNSADFLSFECIYPCTSGPCLNNGTCENSEDFQDYACHCDYPDEDHYTGENCEIIVPCTGENMCGERNCAPGELPFSRKKRGIFGPEVFSRSKRDGFHAPELQVSGPCFNNATCHNAADWLTYSCECGENYTDPTCSTFVPCQSYPCENSGNCTNSIDYRVMTFSNLN